MADNTNRVEPKEGLAQNRLHICLVFEAANF
jgi:hypothetical protein